MPRNEPASLQLWQGGPPIIPSHSGTSSFGIFVILLLSKNVFGWFFSNVFQISLSYSLAYDNFKPALENPKSRPPAPENSDTIFIVLKF